MERHGITRASLKVVPYGLRHHDAADAYHAMTGQLPPVAGGGAVGGQALDPNTASGASLPSRLHSAPSGSAARL